MLVDSPARNRVVIATDPIAQRVATPVVPRTQHLYFGLQVDYATREISINGELDVATASCLTTAVTGLRLAAHGDITVRFDDVTFIDAAGIGAVAGAYAAQLRTGDRLRATGVTTEVRRVFTLSNAAVLLEACTGTVMSAAWQL